MKKKYRCNYLFVLRGMLFSDKVSKGTIKPTGMESLGWGRINSVNAWINNKK
jgi:hypothetical protein